MLGVEVGEVEARRVWWQQAEVREAGHRANQSLVRIQPLGVNSFDGHLPRCQWGPLHLGRCRLHFPFEKVAADVDENVELDVAETGSATDCPCEVRLVREPVMEDSSARSGGGNDAGPRLISNAGGGIDGRNDDVGDDFLPCASDHSRRVDQLDAMVVGPVTPLAELTDVRTEVRPEGGRGRSADRDSVWPRCPGRRRAVNEAPPRWAVMSRSGCGSRNSGRRSAAMVVGQVASTRLRTFATVSVTPRMLTCSPL